MIICTCIHKFRDNSGKITGYRLQDSTSIKDVTPDVLKRAVASGLVQVTNLTLTSDNRLVENSKESRSQLKKSYHINKQDTTNKKVVNYDVKIAEKLKAVPISKEKFMDMLLIYLKSRKVWKKARISDDIIDDIKYDIESYEEYLENKDYNMATFHIIVTLLTLHNFKSINGINLSSCEPYGYSNSKHMEDYTDKSIVEYLSTDECRTGLYTFNNGVTMWFVDIYDDEVYTINVAIYFDGNDFQIYAPLYGNYINAITKSPVNLGMERAPKDRINMANKFIEQEKKKYTAEDFRKITEFADGDEDYINELLIDILYLAKYNKCYNEYKYIVDLATSQVEKDNYDWKANKQEIMNIFSLK